MYYKKPNNWKVNEIDKICKNKFLKDLAKYINAKFSLFKISQKINLTKSI